MGRVCSVKQAASDDRTPVKIVFPRLCVKTCRFFAAHGKNTDCDGFVFLDDLPAAQKPTERVNQKVERLQAFSRLLLDT
jgi:hypothetical protein